ncbi:hypothetical protein GCM10010174_84620 [Kutzneria viridogrisea]|uniref:Uncharacterized protein n=1 Tax=Kutzneria viridogrisea TaxID=47990 RepID=A0ABR6BBL4_9PSEU|nr:hypothetical protein [Kutzneria viridogrisea]
MSEPEDQLRRMLAARADQVRSNLSGPAIRARARSRSAVRRYAPLAAAAAVLAVLVVSLVLVPRGGSEQQPPAAPVPTMQSPTTLEPTPRTGLTTTVSPTTAPATSPSATLATTRQTTSAAGAAG